MENEPTCCLIAKKLLKNGAVDGPMLLKSAKENVLLR
jgi:hypothetical protein